jgi:hypothetical protein
VIVREPALMSVRATEQAPAESVQVVSVRAPSRSVTVPLGVPVEEPTVTASVTDAPYVVAVGVATSVVVVVFAFTVWTNVVELGAWPASPG